MRIYLRLLNIFLLITLLAAGGLIVAPHKEVEAGQALFSISLDSSSVTLQVGPNQSARAVVHGTLRIYRFVPGVSRFMVYLYLDADYPIIGDVTPMLFDFIPGGPMVRNLSVFIRAPLYTPYTDGKHNKPYTVRVKGVWDSIPQGVVGSGEVYEERIMVDIAPYYYFTMNPDPPFKRIWPGERTTFHLEIYNQGNTRDEVTVEVEHAEVWAKEGWAFEIPNPEISIEPRHYGYVEIVIHTPQRLTLWENSFVGIPIVGKSERAELINQKVSYHMSIYFQIWGFYLPEIGWAFVFSIIIFIFIILYQKGYLKRKKRERRRWLRGRKEKREVEELGALLEATPGGPPPPAQPPPEKRERGVKPQPPRVKHPPPEVRERREEMPPLEDLLMSGEGEGEEGGEEELEEILGEGGEEDLSEILS